MGTRIIKYLIDSVLGVIYSSNDNCLICSNYCSEEDLICNNCIKKIEFYNDCFKIIREGIELECYSAAYYKGTVMELIRRLKYKSDFNCGEVLSQMLFKLLNIKKLDYDIITFVPASRKTLKIRGFNQSEFLAKSIGYLLEKPVLNLLKKIRETKDQIGLNAEGRWENLSSCFQVVNKKVLYNKKILLIDDVITTGATAFYCSRELLKHEALKVTILTVSKSRL
ncbi:ComF family protein [Clostridium sp. SYSU_GA19001]|uniref:ComF family protein n=1 Tax=Clostridium caldaquaticum TaxID=2940653 RepID=UPI0020773D98|nr:ComF family protein [Clostridium caldaquaticum]MCM8709752.1 ComF family protein [Clostridium caldaquaticum]